MRTAGISNESGKSVFEQKDVEFPSTWSQNATNIVAQKYFRGQLDSPSRERSVKQMVGRVAGTIAQFFENPRTLCTLGSCARSAPPELVARRPTVCQAAIGTGCLRLSSPIHNLLSELGRILPGFAVLDHRKRVCGYHLFPWRAAA